LAEADLPRPPTRISIESPTIIRITPMLRRSTLEEPNRLGAMTMRPAKAPVVKPHRSRTSGSLRSSGGTGRTLATACHVAVPCLRPATLFSATE